MRIGIAMPGHLAAIVAADAVRHGHDLLFEVASRHELDVAMAEHVPDAVIVAGVVLTGTAAMIRPGTGCAPSQSEMTAAA